MATELTTVLKPDVSRTQLRHSILDMVWPAATENLLQLAVGLVNMAMVGRLGAEAIGAVGLSNRLAQIIWALFMTFSTGAVVRIAQAVGARDRSAAEKTAQQALVGATVFVLILASVLFVLAPGLLAAFGAEQGVVTVGTIYLRILSTGMPFFTMMLVVGAILRGAGDTKTPMHVALLVNVINIAVNYLLIFGRLGFPALGLTGSAIATVFAQALGAAVALYVLFTPNKALAVRRRGLWPLDWREIGQIARLGFPNACETLAWQLAAVIMVGLIIRFGTFALAGYQIGLMVEGISYMPAAALSIAATAFTGRTVGARDPELGRRYVSEITWWGFWGTLVVALALLSLPRQIMRLLTTDPNVVKVGAVYLRFMALIQIPQNIAGILNGSLRGAGHTRQPLVAMAVGLWLVRIPLALLLTNTTQLGLSAIWVAINVDLMVRLALSHLSFRRLAFR